MGSLTPGKKMIYERVNDVVYSREEGADPSSRQEVGWKHDARTSDGRPLHDHIMDSKLWGEIHRKAKTHPGLRDELERVIMFYRLLEEAESNTVMHHPV
jgi:hypothetical protein